MLKVAQLAVTYGTTRAVRGIDLELGAGELVALLGPNGAGKTSTLRAISRLVPCEGSIELDGTSILGWSPMAVARAGLIHVPEGRRVFPSMSVDENLRVGASAQADRPTRFSLEDVYGIFPTLAAIRGREGWQLSGGEQQMLALGRALMAQPRLLVVDEPSLGLAPKVAQRVFEVLGQMRKDVPILIVEQNTALALQVCDRAYVIANGQIRLKGTAAELRQHDDLIRSFLGQTTLAEVAGA